MANFLLKRLTAVVAPSSLLARTNITLGVSALLIAAIATVALYNFVINPISQQSADDEAALLVLSAQTWVELPPDARPYFELEMAESHDLIISEARLDLPKEEEYPDYFDLLTTQLSVRLGSEIRLLAGEDLYWVDVPMAGYELQIGFSPQRQDIQPLYSAIVIVGLGAAIVFFTSLFIVQRITRPLVKVAQQAEHFRGTKEIEPLPENGPRELASLARSFNTMAEEISVLLSNRTTLMAGISHDLRTPLTRMRLALALLPESVDAKLVERFERNLESMDDLIGDTLRFARGAQEPPQEIELVGYVAEILSSYEKSIELKVGEFITPLQGVEHLQDTLAWLSQDPANQVRVHIAPSALRRVLMNLVGNGILHGGRVFVSLEPGEILISDDGPGIPDEHRNEVFQPFFRLDASRSSTTGGSGLGLAIVQQLCQAHGWHIDVHESEWGGAEFCLQFETK